MFTVLEIVKLNPKESGKAYIGCPDMAYKSSAQIKKLNS